MTIEEAIADLLSQLAIATIGGHYHRAKALKISIEALKREEIFRSRVPRSDWCLLPGETEG